MPLARARAPRVRHRTSRWRSPPRCRRSWSASRRRRRRSCPEDTTRPPVAQAIGLYAFVDRNRGMAARLLIRRFASDDEDAIVALWEAAGLTRPWNDPRKDIARKLRVQPE